MITIDYKSRKPIYEQLVDRVTQLALNGAMQPGEQLPSVRQLSAQLGVNPNTVQRAYAMLLQRGVVDTAPGKGNFISQDAESLKLTERRALLDTLCADVRSLKGAGVSREQILEKAGQAYDEEVTA